MAVKFGTSGVRGLASELNDTVCANYMKSFIKHFKLLTEPGFTPKIIFAGDYRDSTDRIKSVMMKTAVELGFKVLDAGLAPTPALAYACQEMYAPGVMITGSHIPGDRNGFKFYLPWGEILKADEVAITKYYHEISDVENVMLEHKVDKSGVLNNIQNNIQSNIQNNVQNNIHSNIQSNGVNIRTGNILTPFIYRYTRLFATNCLAGVKIVFYQHSTLAQLVIPEILKTLGAEVVLALPSEKFVAVDTEAFDANEELLKIIKSEKPFATLSADGDGDRPLVIDENAEMIPGDLLGILCCNFFEADVVVTPVTTNSALEQNSFPNVIRTKVGSPYVIEEMIATKQSNSEVRCCGFEANGGFLLGSDILISKQILNALPTRDSVLPSIIPLILAKHNKLTLSQLVQTISPMATYSDLIRNFDSEKSKFVLEKSLEHFLIQNKKPIKIDQTDGYRFYFENDNIVHLRPSGNAPEFRIYTEAKTKDDALLLAKQAREFIFNSVK